MKENPSQPDGGMRDEYDFRGGTRGKYAERFAEGSNVVVLAPDVAAKLGTSDAVNKALRAYLAADERGDLA